MKKILNSLFFVSIIILVTCSTSQENSLSLEGQWKVYLDSLDLGLEAILNNSESEAQEINLPGTLDDAGIGKANTLEPELNNYVLSGLNRKHQYIGPAFYVREITVPNHWKGKHLILELERVLWSSHLYIDGKEVGSAESLITPHYYDLSDVLTPGNHTIALRIDNSNLYPLINVKGNKYPDPINQDMAHAYTNHTQIKWNGVLGNMQIKATPRAGIENLQVYPKLDQKQIVSKFDRRNGYQGALNYAIKDAKGNIIAEGSVPEGNEVLIPTPAEMQVWHEFNPVLYTLLISDGMVETEAKFGYSNIGRDGKTLTLNGERIFLRGNLECAIFPLTGHPPLEKAKWAALIDQAKAYGLNHLRFHSWCPPKAAFEAADEAGFYYQVELPHWSLRFGEDKRTTDFLKKEAELLLKEYGNHPSFVLMALGNEIQGDVDLLNASVAALKEIDDRHLYMTTAYSFQYPLGVIAQPEDDYFVTQKTDKGWVRGQGIFNTEAPGFRSDYSASSDHVPVPLISHEIGQYAVFPDMTEIPKYTGVLEPLNFIAVSNALEANGLLEMADDFTKASGKLAAILYKEEIERALKTPAFDGFQLLQLQDFPGQGTALVGLLNAMWESKGVIEAEEFRQFNSELVPLLRFDKAVYESGEVFNADVEVANFYKRLENKTISWSIKDAGNKILEQGSFKVDEIPIGNIALSEKIEYTLDTDTAIKLKVEIVLEDTPYQNAWNFWVYPEEVSVSSEDVFYTRSYEAASTALEEGRKVLLNPDYQNLRGIDGRFVPVFWSPVHFPNQPSTMGLLMDEDHPAFRAYPTDFHTNWQWWDPCLRSKSLIVDSLEIEPIVRVIDNFVTNHHLSNTFETKVGNGKLVFTSIDLATNLENRPVARQLRHSLIQYMEGELFDPEKSSVLKDLDFRVEGQTGSFETSDIYKD